MAPIWQLQISEGYFIIVCRKYALDQPAPGCFCEYWSLFLVFLCNDVKPHLYGMLCLIRFKGLMGKEFAEC